AREREGEGERRHGARVRHRRDLPRDPPFQPGVVRAWPGGAPEGDARGASHAKGAASNDAAPASGPRRRARRSSTCDRARRRGCDPDRTRRRVKAEHALRALGLALALSVVLHAVIGFVVRDALTAPSFDFDFELPETVELGLTDEME